MYKKNVSNLKSVFLRLKKCIIIKVKTMKLTINSNFQFRVRAIEYAPDGNITLSIDADKATELAVKAAKEPEVVKVKDPFAEPEKAEEKTAEKKAPAKKTAAKKTTAKKTTKK